MRNHPRSVAAEIARANYLEALRYNQAVDARLLARACQLYNWHTSPSAMRSDWEHTFHRKAARKIRAIVESKFSAHAWHETDSGRLTPL